MIATSSFSPSSWPPSAAICSGCVVSTENQFDTHRRRFAAADAQLATPRFRPRCATRRSM
jgi:hypothetical protein